MSDGRKRNGKHLFDYTGKKFYKLTAIKFIKRENKKTIWECKCDCGNVINLTIRSLVCGHIKDCGCQRSIRNAKHSTKHGLAKTRLYHIFQGMKVRCYNKNDHSYPRYGQRGITICDEWMKDITKFVEWANKNGYKDGLSIDRIDPNKGYFPENCRWVNFKIQANNKTNNKLVTFNGETHTVSEWADKLGMKRKILEQRIRNSEASKYSLEEAFSKKVREHDIMLTFKGKTQNIKSWAEEIGLPYSALNQRIYHGWDIERALTLPLQTNKSRRC